MSRKDQYLSLTENEQRDLLVEIQNVLRQWYGEYDHFRLTVVSNRPMPTRLLDQQRIVSLSSDQRGSDQVKVIEYNDLTSLSRSGPPLSDPETSESLSVAS